MLKTSALALRNMNSRVIRHKDKVRSRIQVQHLEDRITPSSFTVLVETDNFGINTPIGAGTLTLRQAIVDANANPGPDTIEFDATFFSIPRTITLSNVLPDIKGDLSIAGTVATNCIITGSSSIRIFATDSSMMSNLTLSDLTLEDGFTDVDGGGAIYIPNGSLSLSGVTITGSTAFVAIGKPIDGGAVFVSPGDVTISGSTDFAQFEERYGLTF